MSNPVEATPAGEDDVPDEGDGHPPPVQRNEAHPDGVIYAVQGSGTIHVHHEADGRARTPAPSRSLPATAMVGPVSPAGAGIDRGIRAAVGLFLLSAMEAATSSWGWWSPALAVPLAVLAFWRVDGRGIAVLCARFAPDLWDPRRTRKTVTATVQEIEPGTWYCPEREHEQTEKVRAGKQAAADEEHRRAMSAWRAAEAARQLELATWDVRLTAQAAAAMLEPDHPRRTNTRSRTSAAQPRPGLAEPIPRPAPPKVEPVADPLPRRAIVIAPRPDGRRAVARGDGIREVLAAHEVLRAEERPPPAGAVDTRLEAIAAHIPQLVRFAGAGGRRTVRVPGDEPLPLPALADPDWTCLQALLAASRHGLLRVTRHHHLLCLALILRCLAGFDVELRRIPLDLELQDTGQDWLAAIDRLPAP